MTLARGCVPGPSGQWLVGADTLPPSPGCWMLRNSVSLSGVNWQPQISAPIGPLMNCCRRPRCGPSVGQTQQPSFAPRGCVPSVTIHKLPALSKPMLSGEPIGLSSSALA